ncbi:MAG: hypothetical protein GX465_08470 [Acidobacteria bacterium]|nr:hypothetical protein [Acidobacteriota bacterium]
MLAEGLAAGLVHGTGPSYNNRSREPIEGTREMKLKKILLFALGVAVVVAGVLALNKRQK